jgi:filamentous hemagglutinin
MPPNTKAFRWLRIKSRVKGFLREVGSTDRSVLKGALEVFGKNAAVVIANPNGFYCDKCSFINTSKLTMVSGRSPNRVGVCDVD